MCGDLGRHLRFLFSCLGAAASSACCSLLSLRLCLGVPQLWLPNVACLTQLLTSFTCLEAPGLTNRPASANSPQTPTSKKRGHVRPDLPTSCDRPAAALACPTREVPGSIPSSSSDPVCWPCGLPVGRGHSLSAPVLWVAPLPVAPRLTAAQGF